MAHHERIAPRVLRAGEPVQPALSRFAKISVPRDGELDLVGVIKDQFGCFFK